MIKLAIFDFDEVCSKRKAYETISKDIAAKAHLNEARVAQFFIDNDEHLLNGSMTIEEWWGRFNTAFSTKLDASVLRKSFEPCEMNSEILAVIRRLKRHCHTCVISDNIRERWEILKERHGLEQYFDEELISSITKKTKKEMLSPWILSRFSVKPEEMLYVDNSTEFCRLASGLKMNTILFRTEEPFAEDLKKFL